MTQPDSETARSERYAQAIRTAGDTAYGNRPFYEAITEAAIAVADAEQAELRRERDLAIAHDRQPYPTAWAYEQACKALRKHQERADAAEAALARVRLLHDNLVASVELASPEDPITRGAAAERIAAALDGWTAPAPAVLPASVDRDTDGLVAATCSAQYHGDEDGARLCIRGAQHLGKAHTDEHGFHWSDTVAVYPLADGTFRTGINVQAELRRMAAESVPADAGHACRNCEGVDPDTCLMNPDRPKRPPMDPVHILGIGADEQPAGGAQQPKETLSTVGYSGKGRVWCLSCPRPAGEDVPVAVDVLQPYEECAGCGRHVADVARAAAAQQPKETRP
jgi:hypothetical protein